MTEKGFLISEKLPDFAEFILDIRSSATDFEANLEAESKIIEEKARRAQEDIVQLPIATSGYREIAERLKSLRDRVRGSNEEGISDEKKAQTVAEMENTISLWE